MWTKPIDGAYICGIIIPSGGITALFAHGRRQVLRRGAFLVFRSSARSGFIIFVFEREIVDMYVKEVLVQNQVGLHARPATFFIQKANEFKSSIWVEKEERRVNAKSLLGVLSLGIVGGTNIKIIADGSDEESAVDSLVALVESGFAE